MRRVYVDTSVLFPFSVMDLFLALAEDSIHHVLWTDELLDEWERVIVREHQRTPESGTAVTSAIREFFDDARIDPQLYRHSVDQMPGPDLDDHVHSAAAIAARADALITWDKTGFPSKKLAALGLRVVDPDTYLVEVFDELGDGVIVTVDQLARSKTRPPMSTDDLLDRLDGADLVRFTKRVRRG